MYMVWVLLVVIASWLWRTTSSLLTQGISSFSVQYRSLHAFDIFPPLSIEVNPVALAVVVNSAMLLVVMTLKGEMHSVVEVKMEIGMQLNIVASCAIIGMLLVMKQLLLVYIRHCSDDCHINRE